MLAAGIAIVFLSGIGIAVARQDTGNESDSTAIGPTSTTTLVLTPTSIAAVLPTPVPGQQPGVGGRGTTPGAPSDLGNTGAEEMLLLPAGLLLIAFGLSHLIARSNH